MYMRRQNPRMYFLFCSANDTMNLNRAFAILKYAIVIVAYSYLIFNFGCSRLVISASACSVSMSLLSSSLSRL